MRAGNDVAKSSLPQLRQPPLFKSEVVYIQFKACLVQRKVLSHSSQTRLIEWEIGMVS
jgi:hypothetical protein